MMKAHKEAAEGPLLKVKRHNSVASMLPLL